MVPLTNVEVQKLLINPPDSKISTNVKPAFENHWDLIELKNLHLAGGDLLWQKGQWVL